MNETCMMRVFVSLELTGGTEDGRRVGDPLSSGPLNSDRSGNTYEDNLGQCGLRISKVTDK